MYKEGLFQGKTALVTGGRSGIGYAVAKHFLTLGAKVMICSRKEAPLKQAAAELSEFGECRYQTCDIREMEQVQAVADKVESTFGVLDILVNNAGGQFPAPAELISKNGWAAVINNNLNGTFYMSQTMYNRFFSKQSHGNIINIIANIYRGFPGMAHTGAARAGVDNLTKTLAQEWAHNKVRVNAIAPGIIESSGLDQYPPHIQKRFEEGKEENLMKRFGTVEDISNAVMFYASPLSSYVSGTTLYVDGVEHLAGDRMGLIHTMREMLQ